MKCYFHYRTYCDIEKYLWDKFKLWPISKSMWIVYPVAVLNGYITLKQVKSFNSYKFVVLTHFDPEICMKCWPLNIKQPALGLSPLSTEHLAWNVCFRSLTLWASSINIIQSRMSIWMGDIGLHFVRFWIQTQIP